MNDSHANPEFRHAQKWAMAAAVLLVELGLFFAAMAALPSLRLWTLELASLLWWPAATPRFEDSPILACLIGIMGAVFAGWGVTLFLAVRNAENPSIQSVLDALMIGLIVWFILDSALSAYTGAVWNIAINVATLAIFLVPMQVMRRNAVGTPKSSSAQMGLDAGYTT